MQINSAQSAIRADGNVLTYARLSSDVYNDTNPASIDGFSRLRGTTLGRWSSDSGSSFFGACYAKGRTGVVAIRGSAEGQDWYDADVDLARLRIPISQLGDGFDLFGTARNKFEARNVGVIVVTGHSLGGGLAQIIAARVTTIPVIGITFNAPGTANLDGPLHLASSNGRNIYNFRSSRDPVSLRGTHIGRTAISVSTNSPSLVGVGVVGALGSALLDHRMGPLVEALGRSSVGRNNLNWTPR